MLTHFKGAKFCVSKCISSLSKGTSLLLACLHLGNVWQRLLLRLQFRKFTGNILICLWEKQNWNLRVIYARKDLWGHWVQLMSTRPWHWVPCPGFSWTAPGTVMPPSPWAGYSMSDHPSCEEISPHGKPKPAGYKPLFMVTNWTSQDKRRVPNCSRAGLGWTRGAIFFTERVIRHRNGLPQGGV